MKIMTEHGLVDEFAQILCVDNEDLNRIKADPKCINDMGFVIGLLEKVGNNAVIVRLELKNKHSIVGYIVELLKKFDSVSWVHNNKLFTRSKV